jgi:hypothetical protein
MMVGDRRALVWGGLAVLGAVAVLRVLPWSIRGVTSLRAEAADRVLTLSRAREVLEGAPETRDSLAHALSAIVALAPRLVDGSTAAEAQASLSGLVSLTAARQALRIVRLDPLSDSTADGVFSQVAVHVELEGDIAGFTRFLGTVETGDPLLTVPALSVQAPDPSGQANGREQLRIEATIVGFYLPRGSR